ncbi:MAG: hypothetical protein ACU836_19060, partial [Gammaproteobacteria bacterium]
TGNLGSLDIFADDDCNHVHHSSRGHGRNCGPNGAYFSLTADWQSEPPESCGGDQLRFIDTIVFLVGDEALSIAG